MMMQIGQRFRCQTSECAAEIEVTGIQTRAIERYMLLRRGSEKALYQPYSNNEHGERFNLSKAFRPRGIGVSVRRIAGEVGSEQNVC